MSLHGKWERVHQNLAGINKKLENPDIPENKREKLLFQKKHLQEKVIPRLASRLSEMPAFDPLWKTD